MKKVKYTQFLFVFSLICLISLFSCRKKDERYEGNYVGTEQHTMLDSGATEYTLDTTYVQEVDITYSKKIYTFIKKFNNPGNVGFQQDKGSIVDHEHEGVGDLYYDSQGNLVGGFGSFKFSGDSLYISSTSYWNGDSELWEFKGKRK